MVFNNLKIIQFIILLTVFISKSTGFSQHGYPRGAGHLNAPRPIWLIGLDEHIDRLEYRNQIKRIIPKNDDVVTCLQILHANDRLGALFKALLSIEDEDSLFCMKECVLVNEKLLLGRDCLHEVDNA